MPLVRARNFVNAEYTRWFSFEVCSYVCGWLRRLGLAGVTASARMRVTNRARLEFMGFAILQAQSVIMNPF